MPWMWVAMGLVLWTLTALVVIALCMSARQTDGQLGRDREADRGAASREHPASTGGQAE